MEDYPTRNGDQRVHTNYIMAGGELQAMFISGAESEDGNGLFFTYTDYLGSILTVTDVDGNIIADQNFDAWGRMREHEDWTNYDSDDFPTTPRWLIRGYTGHEHLNEFDLINMNGRVYDPTNGRMLSVDNHIQAPYNTQSYNRYSYALNNPLKYTDPDGEFFVIDSWIVGFIHGFFSAGSGRWETGMKEANHRAGIDLKIWGGLFATDPNKYFWGETWEIISRFTWQLPQTIGGWSTTQWANTIEGNVNWVQYKYGATVVQSKGNWGGITQGSYIMGDESIEADANNPLFQHEYGHYIQSQKMGFAYYSRVGIPSALSSGNHNLHPVEQDSNRRAFLYFNKHVEGFQDDSEHSSPSARDNWGWDFWRNPFADGVGTPALYKGRPINYVNYQNSVHVTSLDKIRVRAKWYNYVFPFVSGFYNTY